MLKNILKRPVAVSMIFIIVLVFGVVSYTRLAVNLLPDIKYPSVTIWTEYSGAGPEEIEKEITSSLEAAVGAVNGIKNIASASKDGISLIKIDFVWGTNMDFAVLSLREKLDGIDLPEKAGRPNIIRIDPKDKPIMAVSVSADNLYDARNLAENVIKRRFEQIEGVAMADVTGGEEKEIRILIDPAKLIHLNISLDEIKNAVQSANIDRSGGTVKDDVYLYDLRVSSSLTDLKDIENTRVKQLSGGVNILIRDLATVELADKEKKSFTRYKGKNSVGILIRKDADANTVEVSKKADELIKEISKDNPKITIRKAYDQASFINQSVNGVFQSIWQGGILAFLILIPFLKNFSSPLNIALSIPISVLASFVLMYFSGISLNFMSMSGLALGIGMLVDNAIVVLENINRLKDEGKTRLQAALLGTKEVAMPVMASTLTTVIVFLPIVFTSGVAGELFKDQSITVTFSLLCSIVVALTLLPVVYANLGGNPFKNLTADLSIKSPESRLFKIGSYWFFLLISGYLLTLWLTETELIPMLIFAAYLALIADVKIKFLENWIRLRKLKKHHPEEAATQGGFLRSLLVSLCTMIVVLIGILPAVYISRIDFFEPVNKLAGIIDQSWLYDTVMVWLSDISLLIKDFFTPYEEELGTNTFTVIVYALAAVVLVLQIFGLLNFRRLKKMSVAGSREVEQVLNLRKLGFKLVAKSFRLMTGLLTFWFTGLKKGCHWISVPVFKYFDIGFDRFNTIYHRLLLKALDNCKMTVFFSLLLFLISMLVFTTMEKRLMPAIDSGEFVMSVELPPGTPLERTEALIAEYELLILADSARVATVFSQGGTPDEKSKISGSTIYKAEIQVNLKKGNPANEFISELRQRINSSNQNRPEAVKINFNSEVSILSDFLKVENADLAVKVYGHDLADLEELVARVMDKLKTIDNLTEIKSNFVSKKPKVEISFADDKLAEHNLTPGEIEDYISTLTGGSLIGEFNDYNKKLDIVLARPDSLRQNLAELSKLFFLQNGVQIPLNSLIKVHETVGPEAVNREKQQRVITVSANLKNGNYSRTVQKIEKALAGLELYKDTKIEVGGQNQEMKDSFNQLILMFLLSLLLVYMVLASQFESLLSPFIIILVVPMALIGAIFGLLLFGLSINVMSVIGIIILVGIGVNDAIVKVEFIDNARKEGMTIRQAILSASEKRLRPIIMTSVTTIAGMLPMALAIGGSSELQVPLAITVLFGIIFSTSFTLILTPVIYTLLKREKV